MRGKVTVLVFGSMILRITPAYAGKSTIDGGKHDRSKDHPRLCGEKVCLCHMKKESKGSPPPMRGKGKPLSGAALQVRITPAYAGKSSKTGLSLLPARDHPRLCGEKLAVSCLPFRGAGSPPPMRGKVHKLNKQNLCYRITPAYAGKRSHSGENCKAV